MSATPEQIAVELDDLADSALVPAYHDDLRTAASLIRSLSERNEKLEAENTELKKPEWFYSVEDPEYRSGGDVQDVVDDMDHEGVMEVAGAREVWKKWVAVRCLTVDEEGDVDDTEAATFDTVEEAERCWPESLAACRSAAALERK